MKHNIMKSDLLILKEVKLNSPLDGELNVTSPFGKWRGTYQHHGVDIGTPSGSQLKSPADGIITVAHTKQNACGGTITIDHKNGFKSRFCHLKRIDVTVGDKVTAGQTIALTGGGANDPGKGRSTGPHLHFEFYENGRLVDPMNFIDKVISPGDFKDSEKQSDISNELITKAQKSDFLKKLKDLAEKNITFKNLKSEGSKIPYRKEVENIQIALQFLKHSLPVWGVDGLFGPETANAVKGFQKKMNLKDTGEVDSETMKYLYASLVKNNFEDSDLSKINFTGGYNSNLLDVSPNSVSSDFETMTKIVIDNFEGGYYNPAWHYKPAMGRSGETMFGMDRVHGAGLFKSGPGKRFWEIIDKNKSKEVWKHYYTGGPIKDDLIKLVAMIMEEAYNVNSNMYLSPAAREIVNSNNGLMFHFLYACWNGPGFFKRFANIINKAVEDGIESPQKLLSIAINSRLDGGVTRKSGEKMLKIFKA